MSPRFDVTGFGEIMLRMSVPAGKRLEVATGLEVHPGGAEGNVSCALAGLGRKTAWIGGLPPQPLGHIVRNHLRRANVSTEGIIWKDGHRMGLFFIEFSGPPRVTEVYYDRANSAAAAVEVSELPWEILLDTKIIHLSGITPAISPSCLKCTEEIIARARKKGVMISFDVNYRAKLWTAKRAAEVLTPLIQGVDLLLCSRGDAQTVFGAGGDAESCAKTLAHLSEARNVVVSLGDEGAIAWDGKSFLRAEQGPVAVVDRIGAGDAMAAGILHGVLEGDLKKGLEVGMVLAGLILTLEGDTLITSLAEVNAMLGEKRRSVNR